MCDDVLTEKDYKQLLQFVYSSHRPLAATAGELLFLRYTAFIHQQTKINKKTHFATIYRGYNFSFPGFLMLHQISRMTRVKRRHINA